MSEYGCCTDRRLGHGGCTTDTCMELPDGKACSDCAHCRKCCAMFGHRPSDTFCDWFPRRFVDKDKGHAT